MFDILKERFCDHRIFDEQLSLEGASPNYFARLKFQANYNPTAIEVREFATTNGLTDYYYVVNGFSNWSLSTDGRQINFNSLGLGGSNTGVASFADGSSLIIPQRIYLATYLALPTTCPLHVNPGPAESPIQKDVNINEQGRFDVVTGRDKVRQSVLKALLTITGSNQFHTTYGSLLSNIVGQKFDIFTQFNLQQSIQDAVEFLIAQQQQQISIPLAELILRVSSVDVQQDPTDPRTIQVVIKILTGAYQEVPISFVIIT